MMVYTVEITIEDNEATKDFELTEDQLKIALLKNHNLLHSEDVKVEIFGADEY